MTIEAIRERLVHHRPTVVEGGNYPRAAVAVVLREGDEGVEFVVIRRSHRNDDPWSGHMALPGGRQDPSDRDLFMTAARETHEEVGIDLARHAERLGNLDDLQAIGRGRPLDLIIRPFVCAVTAPVSLTPNHHEVHSAFWLPLESLHREETQGTYRHTVNGHELEHPAYVYQGHAIWGLTYRILTGLLDVLR